MGKSSLYPLFLLVFGVLAFSPAVLGEAVSTPEARYEAAKKNFETFDTGLSFRERKALKETSTADKHRLTPHLQGLFEERQRLREQVIYWDNIRRLQADLASLRGSETLGDTERRQQVREAEIVAITAIDAFGDLKRKYRMVRPALLHNTLVNMGMKKEGLCWHWARDLLIKLQSLDLKTYDLFWASAREGTMREHNTVVLATKGFPLSEGLFLDGWKKSGRPFWMRVKDDKKHPWTLGNPSGVEF